MIVSLLIVLGEDESRDEIAEFEVAKEDEVVVALAGVSVSTLSVELVVTVDAADTDAESMAVDSEVLPSKPTDTTMETTGDVEALPDTSPVPVTVCLRCKRRCVSWSCFEDFDA